ncbi:hypothetical protein [Mesorhizobium sp.]|uniref:hypothetical protein n=1 Tax=Mesorhizobium sp. TaxID=1871066 RepID=UPI000FE51858|nr:hypothetical protein [Mesorhizobium sp.]RWD43893.1 MAG: hypothetical protein EOS35_18610 [Mesorhizobium sp.]TIU09089.1 MAG: hypothetical protein E5W39_03600 [Mesorhizobium sp.]
MARPRKPLAERIGRLSQREGDHLVWQGQIKDGKPYLDRVGNPARILLGLTEHPDYQIRRDESLCDDHRCIEPHHYRVIRERKFKYDDQLSTPWRDPRETSAFTDRELEDIQEAVEMLNNNELPIEDLDQFQPHIKAEILARATT